MTNNFKRRGFNFSKEEELLLLEEIYKQKNVLENKVTNSVSSTDKSDAWNKVLNGFNSINIHPRTLVQIKAKYDNLKTKTRKWAADHKFHMKGTGGGPGTNIPSDPVIEAVLNIINYKTVCGLPSICDDDFEEIPVSSEEVQQEYATGAKEVDDSDVASCSKSYSDFNLEVTDRHIENIVILEENMSETVDEPLTKKIKRAVNEEISTGNVNNGTNWSTYTPKMLKEPVNRRLRPKVPNPTFLVKEEYYKKKIELAEVTIKDMKRRAEEEAIKFEESRVAAQNKERREEEEHEKRITLLDLQIKMAQRDLKLNKHC